MKFCPNCGVQLTPGDRFCQECGAQLDLFQNQPAENITAPEQPPIVVKTAAPISKPVVTPNSTNNSKKSNSGLPYLLIGLLIIGLAFAGWYFVIKPRYDKVQTVTSTVNTNISDSPTRTIAAQPPMPATTTEAPIVREDSIQSITNNNTTTSVQPLTKPEKKEIPIKQKEIVTKINQPPLPVKASPPPVPIAIPKKLVTIYSNWNAGTGLLNNPFLGKNKFGLDKPMFIKKITTYHWNKGKGDNSGGSISLEGNTNYGPFPTRRIVSDDNGTPNTKWIFEPNIVLPAGKYKVEMSNKNTWSYNLKSDGKGFIIIEGYEAD